MLSKHIQICQNISLIIWIIVRTSSCLYITEQSNFQPCSFNNGVLICDNKILVIASALQFQSSPTTKVSRLEILNFPLTEIPDNYISSFADNLLNIKIHSNVTIKSISQNAFKGCSKLTSLEIRSPLTKEENFLNLTEVFRDLVSLEELKLINLNISDLKFNHLKKLVTLSIEDPNLNTISNDIFQNCPALSTLNLVGMKNPTNLLDQFNKWPDNSRVLITSLKLENCNLNAFPVLVRNFVKNLTYLSLAKNAIERIALTDTVELKELQNLILSDTNLVHTELSGLGNLKKLKVLDLNGITTIRDLPPEIEQLESLETITIDMSQFDQITIILPASIRRLSASYLKKSIKIDSKFLSNANKLKFLILSGLQTSELKFLTDRIKVFQDSLKTLSLDDSILLKKDVWEVIRSLKQLDTLYLNKANIESIPDDVLKNLSNLKKLSLSGNKLRYDTINTIGFQTIASHLTDFDLSFNQLVRLPPCLFYFLGNFDNVNLKGISVDCDCNLLWLYEKVKSDSISSPHLNFTCEYGRNAGKFFYQLSDNDLRTCSSSTVDSCLPLKTGNYTIKFDLIYRSDESYFNIENIEASYLKFLFDHIKVGIKQENKTVHSEIDKYELNRTWIRMTKDVQSNIFSVCLILVRNTEEYNLDYNCRIVRADIPVNKGSLTIIVGASVGVAFGVMIIVFGIIMFLWKPTKRKCIEEDHYSSCSSKYSEADETYQNPDQYSEIASNEEYNMDEKGINLQNSAYNVSLPNYYHYKRGFKETVTPSKSVDGGLNVSRMSNRQSRFNKAKSKPSKRKSEFISLHDLTLFDNSLPKKYLTATRASLPHQYISRDLPVPPQAVNPCLETFSEDLPPPKPKFPSTNIKNLLTNADKHLDYFSKYASNKSLCTDESANHPHSGDSGLGVSKLSNLSQIRLSQDNSVII